MEVESAIAPVLMDIDTPPTAREHPDHPDQAGYHPHEKPNSDNPSSQPAARVLTPPTSEDMGKREEVDSSDLSDVDIGADDLEEEDIGEVEPDHYFDDGAIPVFKPTMAQFRDFRKFVNKIDKYGMKSGIVKVVPPKEWHDHLPNLTEAVKKIKVKNPITQEFAGTHGTYTQANIEKQRSYNLPQWKALTEESNHQPPARRGERRKQSEAAQKLRATRPAASPAKSARSTKSNPAPLVEGKRRRGRPPKHRPVQKVPIPSIEGSEQVDVPPTPISPEELSNDGTEPTVKEEVDDTVPNTDASEENVGNDLPSEEQPAEELPAEEKLSEKRKRGRPPNSTKAAKTAKTTKTAKTAKFKSEPKSKAEKAVAKSVTSRRMNNRQEAFEVDEAAFTDFDYHMQDLDQFSRERCQELEEVYWKTINYGTPMYGADMPGSLFDERTDSWNVAKLPNLLDVLGTKVPGVNTAYLYLGMWKATFAWHLEDVDLYSINYIHFGAPKQWYSISQADARRFEAAMKTLWPNDAKHCDQFLRHKTYLISPEKLKSQFNITVNKLVHYEGEFVITYPYGYHSGFNVGYNCAESVNFATDAWLNYGRIAKKCECESDSVWVDVYEIERKLRGEPTPEYYEVTDEEDDGDDDRLPSPPPSLAGKKSTPRKRKRDDKGKDSQPRKTKRIKIRVRAPQREPCILCPNDVPYDILLPTDNGKLAHRLCASYTPETYLAKDNSLEKVYNVSGIDKARLELKCYYCRSKRGAVFQCSSKKCARAYHATCAAAAGVQIDTGPVPTWDEDGTEYVCEGYDFRCRFHRPKRGKNIDVEALERNSLIGDYGRGLKPGDVVQALPFDSDLFAGVVVENLPGELACLVDVVPEGDRVEVEWKWLLVLDPADSLRPKPSPDAKPLPEHLLRHNDNLHASNRKDGVPEIGDPFNDPAYEHKWAEFKSAHSTEVQNPFAVKTVDISKTNHLWYYLGKDSTDAKPRYTDDPQEPVHNPKSHFLDTVKPPPAPYLPRTALPASYSAGHSAPAAPQSVVPRLDKPYIYKPRAPTQPLQPVQQNIYASRLPFQSNPGSRSFSTPTSMPTTGPISRSSPFSSLTDVYQSAGHRQSPPTYQPMPQVRNNASPSTSALGQRIIAPAPPPLNTSIASQQACVSTASPLSSAVAAIGAKTPSGQKTKLDNSPPYRNFYTKTERRYTSQQVEEYTRRYQVLTGSKAPSVTNPTAAVAAAAPVTSMLLAHANPPSQSGSGSQQDSSAALASLRNLPSGSLSEVPGLARAPFTPPSQRPEISSTATMSEYLTMLHRHPMLRNAYLRQPQQYEPAKNSPFSTTAPLSMKALRPADNRASPSSQAVPTTEPVPQFPQVQYQTDEQFTAQVQNSGFGSEPGLGRFEAFIKKLSGANGSSEASPVRTPIGPAANPQPAQSGEVNAELSPERPAYSPISDI